VVVLYRKKRPREQESRMDQEMVIRSGPMAPGNMICSEQGHMSPLQVNITQKLEACCVVGR
jgi:hypothetical protein